MKNQEKISLEISSKYNCYIGFSSICEIAKLIHLFDISPSNKVENSTNSLKSWLYLLNLFFSDQFDANYIQKNEKLEIFYDDSGSELSFKDSSSNSAISEENTQSEIEEVESEKSKKSNSGSEISVKLLKKENRKEIPQIVQEKIQVAKKNLKSRKTISSNRTSFFVYIYLFEKIN